MHTKEVVELLSFGFKYGAPATNYYFDVTFLSNPADVSIDWVDPSSQDGETGIVSVHLSTPSGSVVLD